MTTEISQNEEPETFAASKKIAKRGGKVAGVLAMKLKRNLAEVWFRRKIIFRSLPLLMNWSFLMNNKSIKP